ncbi:MAG: ferredoxin domain-containing protein [bacterium]
MLSREAEESAVLLVAQLMCASARTAPKARGMDDIETRIIREEKERLANKMEDIGKEFNVPFFLRDADNVRRSSLVVLIGTRITPHNLSPCGFCGFSNCEEMQEKGGICAFSLSDLGIAVGSAVSIASLHHIDNRIMYTAGYAALKLGLLPPEVKVAFGIPLSCTGKNIFFDRR